MSDPYNQYSNGGQGYPPHGQSYGQSQGYPHQNQGYQQQGDYQQQQQPQYDNAPADYGPPRRADSYGPPQAGGFQHGQQDGQYGAYDASNPQGQTGY